MSNKQHINDFDDSSVVASGNDRVGPMLHSGEMLELLDLVDDFNERAESFIPDPERLFESTPWGEREGYHRITILHVRLNFIIQLLKANIDLLARVDDPDQPLDYLSRRVLLLETFMDQNLVLQRLRLSGLTALEAGRHIWLSNSLSENQLANIIISTQSVI